MTHLLLFLALVAPPKKQTNVQIMNAQQQVINKLTLENRTLKNALFGPVGTLVRAIKGTDGKPYCPTGDFALMWETLPGPEPRTFQPFCVRVLK